MFKLPDLPYGYDALQPTVSETTMRTHHDKHHKAYVDTTNTLVGEKGLAGKTMEEVVKHAKDAGEQKLFKPVGSGLEPRLVLGMHGPGRRQAGRRIG